jgi:hypothetical protein
MPQCWDANVDAWPSFILVVKLLEQTWEEIMTTVGCAWFWGLWMFGIGSDKWLRKQHHNSLRMIGDLHLYIVLFQSLGFLPWPPCAISYIVTTMGAQMMLAPLENKGLLLYSIDFL